ERRDRGPRGDAGEELSSCGDVAARLHGIHREDGGGEVRRTQEDAAHLLEHDELLDGTAARAAVLLGNRQPLEPELPRHLRPHGAVVSVLGPHKPPHLLRGRLVLEKATDAVAELLLLLGEGEGHRVLLPSRDCVPTFSCRNGTSLETSGSLGSPSTRSPMIVRWIWSVPP